MPVSIFFRVDPALQALASSDPEAPLNAVLDAWQSDAETLLQLEIYKVTARTEARARDTGALASSVTGRVGTRASGKLISVWFNNAQQYAQWGRYYAPYQEGPPIGLSTYTNAPRHMLYDSQTEDAPAIEEWALEAGGSGADAWAGSIQAGTP